MSAPADALNPAAGESHADHAHLDGKCTSWVDEARRIRRIVSAADPVRKATALRMTSDPRNALSGGLDGDV